MLQNRFSLKIINHLKKYRFIKTQWLKTRISMDFPIYLHVEPTNLCNLKCSFCPHYKNKENKKGHLDFNLYKKIIDECAHYQKTILLILHKDGEPLLNPELPELIRYAKLKKAAKIVHFATNGILLKDKISREIIAAEPDDILISIDAARRETYARVKGVDMLEEVEHNVLSFMRLKRELNKEKPLVRVKMIDAPDVHEEVKLFREKWAGKVDQIDISHLCCWPSFPEYKQEQQSLPRQYPCTILWYSPAINWDGRVSTCCLDGDKNRIIGDVRKESIFDIWRGKPLQAIRRKHLENNYAMCSGCSAWSLEPDLAHWLKKITKSEG